MAIEVNKRKRKHNSTATEGGDDNDNDVVPKKIAKKSKTPKKQKLNKQQEIKEDENQKEEHQEEELIETAPGEVAEELKHAEEEHFQDEEEMDNQDSGFEPEEEPEMKFSKDFKMLDFRAKLRGTNFITELRHLLHLTQTRPRIIAKYIEKRGKPLELAEALERIDKTNVLHVAYICQALQLVVMEILSNQKEHMESALHACRYFLKVHGSVLELLLKSNNLQHRRTALKLLTAIVCVEPQLGRQLLSSYDILSNVKTIENFLSHSKYELNAEETVRKCFIHFVLAYLVDGNTLLIRNILDRGILIRALASGLLYDDHVTVCVVLSTLRKYVLESLDISKTKKIQVFDLECCKHFLRLYDWHGPKVYAAKLAKKGNERLVEHEINQIVDAQEREAVEKAAHEFLLVLLTSRKHGISFDAMKHFRQKHNTIQGKLIGAFYRPWCSKLKTELVLKILEACPDLARNTLRHFSGIVNPIYTPQLHWPAACNFLTEIIQMLHPRLLKPAWERMTLTDFTYWIKDVCLPMEVLVHIKGSNTLSYEKFKLRFAAVRLLLAMFTQYSNFMAVINAREQAKGGNSLRRFKFDILNHILLNYPTVERIMLSLYISMQEHDLPAADMLAHLDVTLDLVLIICKEHRSFVNKTTTILDYLEMLRPLYASSSSEVVEASDSAQGKQGNIQLELKAIKTILLLFPKALQPTQSMFSSVLKSFIKAFVFGSETVQREAGDLLHVIFKNTGIFDAGEMEIYLWLEALRFFDVATIDVVSAVFIEVFQVTSVTVEAPPKSSTEELNTNDKNLQKLFENIEQGLSVQAYIETLSISKLLPLIYKGVEIIPPLDKYLETVCLLMFHYYPTPERVYQLYTQEFKSLKKYMSSWLQQNGEQCKLKSPIAAHVPLLQELQTVILDGGKKFEDFFTASSSDANALEMQLNGKQLKLVPVLRNERMLLIYSQLIIFTVSQLLAKQQLKESQALLASSYLKSFIAIAQVLQGDENEAIANVSAEGESKRHSLLSQLLKYVFSTRLSYISSAEIFNASEASNLHFLHFLSELTESCNELEDFAIFSANYRLKIVKAVAISMQQLEQSIEDSSKLLISLRLVQVFHLDAENCVEILNLLVSQLKYSQFIVPVTGQRTIYYELLVAMLQRLAKLQQCVRCDDFMRKCVKLYVNFVHKIKADTNLEQLEMALLQFLLVSHQYIPELDGKFFDSFFVERKLTKSTVKLACLLLERDAKLSENFLELLPANIGRKELVYPLLKIAFEKQFHIDSTLLNSIYLEYKNGFMKTIEKPQKAGVIYKENVESSLALIAHCMPKSECVDFCNKNFKFDVIELYQMRIINAIYSKALSSLQESDTEGAASSKQIATIFVNFVNVQIQMLSVDLKKQALDQEKLDYFAYHLHEWFKRKPILKPLNGEEQQQLDSSENLYDFSRILGGQQWLNFCKAALKLGMQRSESEEELAKADGLNGLLLKLLAHLCNQMYADFADDYAEPALLVEMIFTHSKFYDIIFEQSSATPSSVKTQLLHLFYVLAKKSPTQCFKERQIPVVLGAYQARLTDADRYALALLELYETYNLGLHKYRPFIWGESAIAFYALRSADEERAKLSQVETSIAQVMSLIDRQVCDYTIDNFPIWRRLHSSLQLPDVSFDDPMQRVWAFGSNALERRIELKQQDFSVEELRLCPKRAAIYEQCYDPAFFLPLMSMCYAPESFAHPARPVQNGLLAMVFAALSSQDREMRLAAGCVQLRYRAHFESSKFFERPLWMQAYENIQSGLSELRDNWMKHKRNSGTPRVPFISALFVAKSFNITTEPTHLLYKKLTMYLRLKSSFNFQCIPEFNVLFYSPDVEHQQFRQFIIEIIRNGIKSSSDLFLLLSTHTFKVLMGFYGSPMSTLELNLQILSLFSTCAKIPASTKIMIEHVGLLPWISSIICSLEFYHFDIIEGLISIVNNLWYALKANTAEFHNYQHICSDIHRLLLRLLPHISTRISLASFSKLLNILHKTVQPEQYVAMSETQLDHLIGCSRKHFPELIHTVEGIRKYGGAGAESLQQYCEKLRAQNIDSISTLALVSLRSYVSEWWQYCHSINGSDQNGAEVVKEP